MSASPAVGPATDADTGALAALLARAFADDPMARWLLPDAESRLPRLERWFGVSLRRLYLPRHECFTTRERTGVAIWVPSGSPIGAADYLRVLPDALRIFGRNFARNVSALAAVTRRRPDRPHRHLLAIGVDPPRQGGGIGTVLLEHGLARCDRAGELAFLRATSARSRALYERHRFVAVEEMRLGSGPPLWSMVREPAGASTRSG